MRLRLRVRGVTAVPWHTSPPPPLPSPSLIVASPWMWPCAPTAHAFASRRQLTINLRRACCRGGRRRHMVTHDLRANTRAGLVCPPPTPTMCPPTPHKHTNKGLHKLPRNVLLCIFLLTLRCCMQLCHQSKEIGLIPAAENISYGFLMHFCKLVNDLCTSYVCKM